MKSGVYEIFNVINSRQYVGSAVNVHARFQDHRSELARGAHPNTHLQRAWDKYGHDSFIFSLIEPAPVRILIEREQFWMDAYGVANDGYNILPTAASSLGFRHSAETKAKMSKSHTGVKMPPGHGEKTGVKLRGRKLSRATRKKMSEAAKKRPPNFIDREHSDETKAKISAAKKGRVPGNRLGSTWSDETREKHRVARLRRQGEKKCR